MIDYKLHQPLHRVLKEKHSETPFNAIFDVAGDNSIFTQSESYLTKQGIFLVLGAIGASHAPTLAGFLRFACMVQWYKYAPMIVGGRYRAYNAIPDGEGMEKIKEMVETRQIKPVTDSVWAMEDGTKVSYRTAKPGSGH